MQLFTRKKKLKRVNLDYEKVDKFVEIDKKERNFILAFYRDSGMGKLQ